MRRRMLASIVWGACCGGIAVGGSGAEPAVYGGGVAERPVVLVEHAVERSSPFVDDPQGASRASRLPAVPSTDPAAPSPASYSAIAPASDERWQPETRLEPAVRVDRTGRTVYVPARGPAPVPPNSERSTLSSAPSSDVWRSLAAPPVAATPNVTTSPAFAAAPFANPPGGSTPSVTTYRPLPIVVGAGAVAPGPYVPAAASSGWGPTPTPVAPYSIGGVAPRVPTPRPDPRYAAKTLWGDTKLFASGEPVRNLMRYLTP